MLIHRSMKIGIMNKGKYKGCNIREEAIDKE